MEEIDQSLERTLLLVKAVRPDGREGAVCVHEAGQVLEPAPGGEERIALEVEEEVALGGLWEQAEAALGLRRQQLVAVPAGAAVLELEGGLVAQRLEGRRRDPLDVGAGEHVAQLLERRDARGLEPPDLLAADERDARQVVVALPLLGATGQEVADAAVSYGP